ncbi:MAG: hypothetical protein ABI120_03875, partial [Gemmatimonadaceae bacterium]
LALQQIYTLSRAAYDEAVNTRDAAAQARALKEQIAKVLPQSTGVTSAALSAYATKLETLAGAAATGGRGGRGGGGGGGGGRGGAVAAPVVETLSGASTALGGVMNLLQGADVRPTTVQLNAIAAARAQGTRVMTRWTALRTTELAALNRTLTAARLSAIGK